MSYRRAKFQPNESFIHSIYIKNTVESENGARCKATFNTRQEEEKRRESWWGGMIPFISGRVVVAWGQYRCADLIRILVGSERY